MFFLCGLIIIYCKTEWGDVNKEGEEENEVVEMDVEEKEENERKHSIVCRPRLS